MVAGGHIEASVVDLLRSIDGMGVTECAGYALCDKKGQRTLVAHRAPTVMCRRLHVQAA